MSVQVEACSNLLPPYSLVRSLESQTADQYIFDIITNRQYAITSASDSKIRIFDLATLDQVSAIGVGSSKINKIKAIDDHHIFAALDNGHLHRWDLRIPDLTPAQTFTYDKPLTAFDINCDRSMAIVGTELDTKMRQTDLAFFDARQTKFVHVFTDSHSDDVTDIQCHPTISSQFISGSTDGLVNNYDLSTMDEEEALLSVINSQSSINKTGYFGPNAEYIFYLTHVETFALCTLESDLICDYGDIRHVQVATVDYAIDCSYDPVSQRFYLITGNNMGEAQLFHVNVGQLQLCQTLAGHSDTIRSIHWNHPAQVILTGGEDGRISAWQALS